MVRFLHTADWQLGLKLAFIEGDRGAWARGERFEVVRRLAALAKERDVVACVVAGDVFDDNAVGPETLQRACDVLAAFAPIPVLLLPGNHDAATPDAVLGKIGRAGDQVRPLLDRTPIALEGVTFYPCPLFRRHERDDPTRELPARGAGEPVRVAIAHGGVLDFATDGEAPNRIDAPAVLAKGFDYLALGDWHGTLSFGPRVWYPGAPEATRFKEKDPGNALVVEIDGPGATPRVEVVRVAATRWISRDVSLDDDADVDALAAYFAEIPEKSRTLVDLVLGGAISIGARARLDRLLERCAGELMHLRVDDARLHDRPSDDDLRALDAEGFIGKAAARLREDPSPASSAALRLLHRWIVEERS